MEYRNFEKIGVEASLLGFGTMRLPVLNGDASKINEDEAIKMIRYAIDNGVNYIDTAYMYHDGNSEVTTGKALKNGYREKVYLADKMPVWFAKSEEDIEKIFETQLKRLDVDCIDFYLIHNITKQIWKIAKKYRLPDFLERKKSEGKIKYIGFSFHDSVDIFKEVIDSYPWDFCQIQFNYMDTHYQAGIEGLQYAASKNIPVIVMEPLKGGRLAKNPPEAVEKVWNSFPTKYSSAEWALRWIADFPEVKVILSGMNTIKEVQQNINILRKMKPNTMSKEEHGLVDRAKAAFADLIKVDCTACNYCMPCPSKVNIPKIFSLYNEMFLYDTKDLTLRDYKMFVPKKQRPSACVECGKCEEHCPQQLPIIQLLKEAEKVMK